MFFNLKNVFQPFLIKSIIPDSDCYLCHEKVKSYTNQSKLICHHCHARLPILQNGCPICAMPTASKPSNALNQPCGACLKKTPHYHKTVSAFHYETPINDFITSLKFNGQHYFVPLLSEYLLKAIEVKYEVDERPEVIVPVPLHSKKLRERGFNQALLIAQSLSKQLNIPLLTQAATRTRYTKAQSALDANQRHRNLKGAFSVNPVNYKTVAIVDDVMTTGTTANELSYQLIQAGISRVDIWCIARAFST